MISTLLAFNLLALAQRYQTMAVMLLALWPYVPLRLNDYRQLYRRMQFSTQYSMQFSATFQNATPRPTPRWSVSDVHLVECERYRRAWIVTTQCDVTAKPPTSTLRMRKRSRGISRTFTMQIRAPVVRLEFLTRRPLAMEIAEGDFELIMGCNSSWFALHRRVFVTDAEEVSLFQCNVRIT